MRVLVTGHTGFKGSWLTLLLLQQGHEVSGLALDPLPGSLFEAADVGARMSSDVRCDIRDSQRVRRIAIEVQPEIVIHLAAQALVLPAYRNPRETVETNVLGTLSILEAVSETASVRSAVVVTTDKVYRSSGKRMAYRESDSLGGHDPYSASKAMADILTSSWTASFPDLPIGIARAGNVIGGGDVSEHRLMPDIFRALRESRAPSLRSPHAVRPWQHVLDCLSGYWKLAEALTEGSASGAWNFGPEPTSFKSVEDAADLAIQFWGQDIRWRPDLHHQPYEAEFLTLDATRSQAELGWSNLLGFEESVEWTARWERRRFGGESALDLTREQIGEYLALGELQP